MCHHLIYSVLVAVCYCRAQGCCITSPCPTTAWCSAAKWWTALFKSKTSFAWVKRPDTTRIGVREVTAESEYPFLWIMITNGTLYASIILSTWKQLYKRPQPHVEAFNTKTKSLSCLTLVWNPTFPWTMGSSNVRTAFTCTKRPPTASLFCWKTCPQNGP